MNSSSTNNSSITGTGAVASKERYRERVLYWAESLEASRSRTFDILELWTILLVTCPLPTTATVVVGSLEYVSIVRVWFFVYKTLI